MHKNNGISELERMKRQTILEIATLIREYCDRKGISIEELARQAGVSRRTMMSITGYDGGDNPPNPTLETLKQIYQSIGVEDWLAKKR